MAGIKFLADGRTKVSILTSAPANLQAPTTTELNAGIDCTNKVVVSDFTFTAGDSDKIAERGLGDINNVNALGASNFQAAITVWRFFNASTGVADPTDDALWTAVKTKGSTIYIYARRTGKFATQAWASGDELYQGGSVITDLPQLLSDLGGFLKHRIPCEPQQMYSNITVA